MQNQDGIKEKLILKNISRDNAYYRIKSWMNKNNISITKNEPPTNIKGIYDLESKNIGDIDISASIIDINIEESIKYITIDIKIYKLKRLWVFDNYSLDKFQYVVIYYSILEEFDIHKRKDIKYNNILKNIIKMRSMFCLAILAITPIVFNLLGEENRHWFFLFALFEGFIVLDIVGKNKRVRQVSQNLFRSA